MSLKYPDLIRVVRDEEAILDDQQATFHPAYASLVEVRPARAVDQESEIATLKSQMAQVMEMMTTLMAKFSEVTTEGETVSRAPQSKSAGSNQRPVSDKVCFNCRGAGHYRRVCPSPMKPEASCQKPAGNFRGPR